MAVTEATLKIIVDAQDEASRTIQGVIGAIGGGNGLGGVMGSVVAGGFLAAAGAITAYEAAVLRATGESIGMAGDFQEQMGILQVATQSVADVTGEELHAAALQVGGDVDLVGVTAEGAAGSLIELYKQGLTTTEIFGDLGGYLEGTAELGGTLRSAIDLAAASELDMVRASDLAATTLATFGGELETEAERAAFVNDAMNNIVRTADASVASVGELADAYTNVGPTAAAFGFSLDDVNVALGLLSTRGIRGAEAGTNLKSMMTNLMRPTNKVRDTLRDLGVSLYDAEGAMLTLPEIMTQLETSLSGLSEEQRNQAIQTLAGAYGMKAMQTLLAEGQQGWQDMETAVANAADTQDYAAVRADSFNGQMEALEGTVEKLKIEAGENFLPVAQRMLGWFVEMVDEHGPTMIAVIEGIMDGYRELAPEVLELANALGLDVDTVQELVDALITDGLLKYLEQAETWFANTTLVVNAITDAIYGARDAVDWFRDGLRNMRDALPDWLIPGSPTPFETGLRGIADAIDGMPDLQLGAGLRLPAGSGGGGGAGLLAAAGGGGGVVVQITNHFGPGAVRSDEDIEEISRRQEELLRLRGVREFYT